MRYHNDILLTIPNNSWSTKIQRAVEENYIIKENSKYKEYTCHIISPFIFRHNR